jgi:UDP-N-acetylmuramate--alanine ligase
MKEYIPPRGSIPTLDVPDLSALRRVHLVGIGGAGMSGLARLFLPGGVEVSGSDLKESPALAELRALGAVVAVGHDAGRLGEPDAVIVSTAIGPGNPEVEEAHRRGIAVLARAQVLAAMMRERRGIAVAGTHGKTTTTSMLAVILERAGLDPTYVVGGDLNESGSNARSGSGDVFLAEADESDGSFLLLEPEVGVVTNVEADHLDFYRDAPEIEAAFTAFCRRSRLVVACADDPGAVRVVEASGATAVWYGEAAGADVAIEGTTLGRGGGTCRIRVSATGGLEPWSGRLVVPVPGGQHLLNAAAAVAVATRMGIAAADAVEALEGFGGVRRRWEVRGRIGGAAFVDDYAHHPTEISATLRAARADGADRIVAVFQPHRFSRTAALWRSLGESLADADLVVVTDVYGAGELPVPGVTGKLVVDGLVEAAPGKRAVYLPRRSDVAAFLAREVRPGDLVLTLGAGDITMVGSETLSILGAARGG